jgi:hypothetical protein
MKFRLIRLNRSSAIVTPTSMWAQNQRKKIIPVLIVGRQIKFSQIIPLDLETIFLHNDIFK